METRQCTTCKKELPANLDYFYKSSKVRSGLQSVCKTCASDRERRYREINNAVFNPEVPELKRYVNGKVDIVLFHKKKHLSRTMSYPLFLEKYTGEKLETLVIK